MQLTLRDRVLDKLARKSPALVAAMLDRLRPALASGFGGPFNGQLRRIEAVRDMIGSIQLKTIVETGTYRGTTTAFLRGLDAAPLITIESNERYFRYSRWRLRRLPDIAFIRGDSARHLAELAEDPKWNGGPTFFYLDAHWEKALPLLAELKAITTGWSDFVVLIDDFRVPGDPGYGYDDYGPGQVLELGILNVIRHEPIVVFWPAASSANETGAKRGWVVLASVGRMDEALERLPSLRRGGSLQATLAGT